MSTVIEEVELPLNIAVNTSGGPGILVGIVKGMGDLDERIVRSPHARRHYDLRSGLRDRAQGAALAAFFIARNGVANGWLLRDPFDNSTKADHISAPTAIDIQIQPFGDGITTVFQLRTQYISGNTVVYRDIYKPVAGTVRVAVNLVEQVSPGWTLPWSVDVTTGLITFTTPPAPGAVISAGCYFNTPVQFGEELASTHLAASFEDFDQERFDQIPAVEMPGLTTTPQPRPTLGGNTIVANTNMRLNWTMGAAILFSGNGNVKIYLPSERDLISGPYHHFVNGTTGALEFVRTDGNQQLAVLNSTKSALSFVHPAGGENYWAFALPT